MLVVRELKLFLFLFLFLAFLVHFNAWIDHPIAQIKALSHSSLGVFHPLYIVTVVYIFILCMRGLIYFFKYLGKKDVQRKKDTYI
jgi:uncharacterized BrkB/YihY/UPF0761 family membrane protein